MLHEFALEPGLLNSWVRFQLFVGQFGVEHGRLISRYPKSWKSMVYGSLQDCGDIERKRIEEALTRIDNRLVKRSGNYVPAHGWLLSAEQEHVRKPFHAIVANSNPRTNPSVLVSDDLDDTEPHELWTVPRTVLIPRTAEALIAAISPLLRIAKRIILVDPHFGPENPRHRKPLERLLQVISTERLEERCPQIEFHLGDKAPAEFFRATCEQRITSLLPNGVACKFVRWRQNCLHNRYVITDCGAVQLGQGLDENQGAGPDHDCITLLGKEVAKQLLQMHTTNPVGNLLFVDDVTILGR